MDLIIRVGKYDLRELTITNSEISNNHPKSVWAGIPQQPIDFGWGKFGSPEKMVNQPITMNVDCKVINTLVPSKSGVGSYCRVEATIDGNKYQFLFGHTRNFKSVGVVIKAGDKICKIAGTDQNKGFAIHLHASVQKNGKSYRIRDIALKPLTVIKPPDVLPSEPVKPDPAIELQKKINELEVINEKLNSELAQTKKDCDIIKQQSESKDTTIKGLNNRIVELQAELEVEKNKVSGIARIVELIKSIFSRK